MNKDQFIYWLKGFVDAAQVSPTQIQWKLIKEKLDEIKDCPNYSSPIGEGGWGTPNTIPLWKEPHYPNQLDKYKITCETEKSDIGVIYDDDGKSIGIKGSTGIISSRGGTSSGNHSVITTNGNISSITTELPKYSTLTYTLKDDSKDS